MDRDAETALIPEGRPDDDSRVRLSPEPAWESYYGELRKFVARQLGSQQDADDVVQDIYRELLRSRWVEAANPRAWLWKIAWRVVHDAFARAKRQRGHLVTADPESIESLRSARLSTSPSVDLQLEAQDELLNALKGLPVAAQIAIVRHRRDGYTYEQIAVELGVSAHMVKHHIARAIAHFDAYFEQADRKADEKEIRP